MKRLILLLAFLGLIVSIAVGTLGTYPINYTNVSNPMALDALLRNRIGGIEDTINGPAITNTVEVFDANDTLTAAESGKVCVSISFTGAVDSNNLILTLPPAAAGLRFTFVDANATATDDLWITASTGDTINGGTAAKSFKNTGDVVNASCVFECKDATDWIAMPSAIGTWANDNN